MSAGVPERDGRKILAKAWRGLRVGLEVLGILRPAPQVDHKAQVARFRLYHTEFRKLLSANNSFLETLAELEERRRGRGFIDRDYVKRKAIRCIVDVHAMATSIETISEGRHSGLAPALQRITARVLSAIEESSVSPSRELVLDLDHIRASHADLVGGKMANLGEARNGLGLPTPEGFAITVEGFRLVLEEAGLRSWIQDQSLQLTSTGMVEKVSKEVTEKILQARIPSELFQAMEAALERMERKAGRPLDLAVRSSALGEDSTLSFAGQFKSLLHVSRADVSKAYLEVLASLFSPEAIHYRILHGIPPESAEMAVGVVEMVPAKAAGVVFSKNPTRPESNEVVIQGVRGLAVPLVEGRVSPETIVVEDPLGARPLIRRIPPPATESPEDRNQGEKKPVIEERDALVLARWAVKLEEHFAFPQDMEFAISHGGDIYLVQTRPLRLPPALEKGGEVLQDSKVLVRGGETACPGVASGVAVRMDEDGDLDTFPQGGVLVARRSSPKFVRIMSRVKAIVTDSGSTTGHMASLARELGIPALLNTGKATTSIDPGTLVTVDASARVVYEGDVSSLILARKEPLKTSHPAKAPVARAPEMELLDRVLEHISPLTLTDPKSPEFSPDNARTLHDLARYIHEKSYEEMFGLGEKLGEMRPASYLLDVFLPIDLYILDLGGGLKELPASRKVKPSQIACIPLRALLQGMLHERIPRFGPRFMDLGGFLSVMMRHATTAPEEERTFQDPCYALISDYYLNYTARVGYHFSVLDTYCSPTPNKNYISLTFRGGAADYTRRARRAWAIAGVLKHLGFSVTLLQDSVNARLGKASMDETREKLEMVGRMLQFFRQMDAAMATDDHARMFQEAFIKGDYDLSQTLGSKN
jgi:pyruvate,water dikinase